MMQQEIGVSEETTKGAVKAHNKQDLCVCVILTQLAAAPIMNMEETGKKLNSCKVAAFKGNTQFYLIKNLIRYVWCFVTQLDVRLKESSLFPPCSRPHGR